ncbi:hypothetical protein K505DRAFT_31768 [Melanomma pulvis-pyrius CBS 109.77]|uniref:Uncharacterized protein n=1 Tax=Melanomma pulvis-pyrius CBS 109.77 TaxID=1314802 RepID=A0A6A6XBT6_9PLEO|nr:hypothetical protein K505DRAFT_31768 [Melanomma pulvis-pyrius CBS 109.77]
MASSQARSHSADARESRTAHLGARPMARRRAQPFTAERAALPDGAGAPNRMRRCGAGREAEHPLAGSAQHLRNGRSSWHGAVEHGAGEQNSCAVVRAAVQSVVAATSPVRLLLVIVPLDAPCDAEWMHRCQRPAGERCSRPKCGTRQAPLAAGAALTIEPLLCLQSIFMNAR